MRCHFGCGRVASRLGFRDNVAYVACAMCAFLKARDVLWTNLAAWRKLR